MTEGERIERMINEYVRAKLLRDLPYLIISAATFIGLPLYFLWVLP